MNIYGRRHHCQHTYVITKLFYNKSMKNILVIEFFHFKCTDHFKYHDFHLVQTSSASYWTLFCGFRFESKLMIRVEHYQHSTGKHWNNRISQHPFITSFILVKYPSAQKWANCDLWVNFYHSKWDSETLTMEYCQVYQATSYWHLTESIYLRHFHF